MTKTTIAKYCGNKDWGNRSYAKPKSIVRHSRIAGPRRTATTKASKMVVKIRSFDGSLKPEKGGNAKVRYMFLNII